MKAVLNSTILLSILSPFSSSLYSKCIDVPGLWFKNPPQIFRVNPYIVRKIQAEKSRLAYLDHRKKVEMAWAERREKYAAELKAKIEERERKSREKAEAEEAKYRTFTGKNGKTIEAKVVAVSPLVRKAKLKSRSGNTFEIALSNFSDDDVVYLKSHLN